MRYKKPLVILAAFTFAVGVMAQDETSDIEKPETLAKTTEPRHVRVTWMDEPATKAVISWSTKVESDTNILFYDTVSRKESGQDYTHEVNDIHSGAYTVTEDDTAYGQEPLYYHHAYMEGLEPHTEYYFVVESDGAASDEYYFRTAPDDDRPVSILFGGDSRIGGSEPYLHVDRRAMNRRMAALAEEHPDIVAFCHGGDFYQRAELRYMEPWLTDHELAVTADNRIIPVVPARGNHDRAIGFEEMFWWPDMENDYYYTTQLSAEVIMITLNTEISLAGDQRTWLRRTLKELRPEIRWLTVQYHQPAYSSVRGWTDGEDRRHYWVPLFEEFDVDLVCESHDHALKRTLPIREGGPHEQGITYIGDGGLGVPQRTPDPTRWYLQEPGLTKSVHHVQFIEFQDVQIKGWAIGMEDEVLDEFSIAPNEALLETAAD